VPALEAGINFFDTANVDSLGTSEEVVGRALTDFANRDEVVIATKMHGAVRTGRNAIGLSRKAIMTEVDASTSTTPWPPSTSRSPPTRSLNLRGLRAAPRGRVPVSNRAAHGAVQPVRAVIAGAGADLAGPVGLLRVVVVSARSSRRESGRHAFGVVRRALVGVKPSPG
jgi:hypothetical protein